MNNAIKVFTLLFLGLNSFSFFSQNPGNVGTPNLTAWFKPDALPLGNVAAWTTAFSSLGPITVTDATAPYAQATNTPPGNVSNYNTTLSFSGNTSTNLQALEFPAQLNLLQNFFGTSQGTFFGAYYLPAATTNGHMMLYNNSPHAIQFRNLGANGRIAIGQSASTNINASRDWTEDFVPNIVSYKGNRTTATSMTAYERGITIPAVTPSQSTGPTGLYFGNYAGLAGSEYNGYLHEFIFYDRNLTALEISKVHTYLSIKYGITLDNTGGGIIGDYVATNGTTIWDASVNPLYHNNIIGIGRDDAQGLLQKQSHAFNDNYRIYMNNLSATNAGNTAAFANDISYITIGQLIASGCGTAASSAEAPAGIQARIAKEWKITNTNFNQTFNLDLKIDTCTIIGTSVGPVNLANFRLLVDPDGDFTNATVITPGAGLGFTYANGYVSVTGISNAILPANSTNYITLAYNTTVAYFTGNQTICNGDSSAVTIHILNAQGPINVQYSNGTTTTTLTNVNDGDVIYLSPTTTTTYTIPGNLNFLTCCGSIVDSVFTLTVHPIPTVTATATPNTLCFGDSTLLVGGGALTYLWNNGASNNTYVTPLATTTYSVVGTDGNGCIDSTTVTVTVNALPIVSATSSVPSLCVGEPVTLNGIGATNYAWDNGVVDNVAFNPIATITYHVTGSNPNGCEDTASVQVLVNQLPNVVANTTDSVICINETSSVFGTGALTYAWNNGVTDNTVFAPISTLMYTVTGTDANNCENVDSILITVNSLPMVLANAGSTTICDNETTQLTGSGAVTYVWNNGVTNGNFVGPNTTTTYNVTGTDANGCMNNASITITVNPSPTVTANTDNDFFCAGSAVTLTGAGATNYVWNNGVTNNVAFNPAATANYRVIGTDGLGCKDTAFITITVYPLPAVQANSSTFGVCLGNSATLSGSGALSYAWDNGITNGVPFVPSVTTTYTVTGTDANGCQNTDNVVLTVYPVLNFNLGPDDTICPQNPEVLFANAPFSSYLWNTGSTAPQITVSTAGTYVLIVTDINGCTYTDAQTISVGEDCFPLVFIPNAFTPNGDEFNRSLRTTGDNLDKFEIRIYNRWGQLLFQSFDIDEHWDGTYGGKVCPDGVYTYYVTYTTNAGNDDKLHLHGHVSILR